MATSTQLVLFQVGHGSRRENFRLVTRLVHLLPSCHCNVVCNHLDGQGGKDGLSNGRNRWDSDDRVTDAINLLIALVSHTKHATLSGVDLLHVAQDLFKRAVIWSNKDDRHESVHIAISQCH